MKGAFLESIEQGPADAGEVTAQYRHLTEWALAHLPDPAFGTHDDSCINHVKLLAGRLGVSHRDFEFQMLYGVRRDLQAQLAADGLPDPDLRPVRHQWYPYLMRRMVPRFPRQRHDSHRWKTVSLGTGRHLHRTAVVMARARQSLEYRRSHSVLDA